MTSMVTAGVKSVVPEGLLAGHRESGGAAVPSRSEYGGAADRMVRRIGLCVGLGGVIALIMVSPEVVNQSSVISLYWSLAIMALAFGWFPVLAAVSLYSSPRVIRQVSGVAAASFFAALVVLLVAFAIPADSSASLWLYRLLAVGVLAAALAWPTVLAVGYLVVGAGMTMVANLLVSHQHSMLAAFGDFARPTGLCALFVWCVVFARASAVRVDHEAQLAGRKAARVGAAAARDRERDRFAALIHDGVLSTLLDASRAGSESPVLRRQAERTLEQLDAARIGDTELDHLDAQAAIGFLRSAIHEVNAGIAITAHRHSGLDDLRLPVSAASTIAAALAEAARNSLRHASVPGRYVQRQVTVTVSAGSIRVTFRDDGAGFDESAVPGDRLGISVSILGRMRQLAGGSGFVESEPGEGTTVTLVWGSDG